MSTLNFDPSAAAPDDSGIFGLPHTAEQAKVVLIPVPFEATTSYGGGTSRGPDAVLEASRQVDLFDVDNGRIYQPGIHLLETSKELLAWNEEAKRLASPIIDVGGDIEGDADALKALGRVNQLSGQLNTWLYETAKHWLAQDKLVGTIGGDHSISLGTIRAHAEKYPGMGILHLDAHADLRVAYEGFTYSHASIMYNVYAELPGVAKLVQVGIRDFSEDEHTLIRESKGRIHTFYDAQLQHARFEGTPWNRQVDAIVAELPQDVYLSWDIDGLDPTLCPSTGTPVPGGLSFAEAVALMAGVLRSGRRIVGLDLCEVAPGPDGSQWDGNVGARLLYKMIGFMLQSQKLLKK